MPEQLLLRFCGLARAKREQSIDNMKIASCSGLLILCPYVHVPGRCKWCNASLGTIMPMADLIPPRQSRRDCMLQQSSDGDRVIAAEKLKIALDTTVIRRMPVEADHCQ